MHIRKTLVTLALASAFMLTEWAPQSLAQNIASRSAHELITPNNDAGSGGSDAPGTKVSGPYQPANTDPGIGERSDNSITKAVKHMLAGDANTRNSNIDVTTRDRMVILHGQVASLAQAKKAEALASEVNGVKGVENQLDYHTGAEHMQAPQ
jgi:hyperosmotically inducible periplasmic protein